MGINYIQKNDILVKLSLILFTVAQIDGRTSRPLFQDFSNYLILGAVICVLVNMFIESKETLRNLIMLIGFGVLLVINCIYCEMHMPLYLFLLIFGLRKSNPKEYLTFAIRLITLFTVTICVLCLFGFYEDLVFIHGPRIQHCMGFSSWTILPFQYNALASYYIYSRKHKISLIEYFIILIIGYMIYAYTDTKSALAFLVVLCMICYSLRKIKHISWNKLSIFKLFPFGIAIISFLMTILYDHGFGIITRLNLIFNKRLTHASKALAKYGISFLGHGQSSWFPSEFNDSYMVVDNSYIYNVLMYGALGLILILMLYTFLISYSIKVKDEYLLVIILVFLLENIIWERLLTFPDFAFILLAGEMFRKMNGKYVQSDVIKMEVN